MLKLLRVEEAAERLALKPATIRKMLYRRELTPVHPTRRAVRVREDEIEALARVGFRPREGGR